MNIRIRPILGVTALLAGALVTGAGCGDHRQPTPTKRAKDTSQREVGNVINYEPAGTSTQLDCAAGKSLNVAGSNNTLTVRGTCTSVTIAGADNRVTFDRIEKSLTITGLANTIWYQAGEPTVDDRGSGNTVSRR